MGAMKKRQGEITTTKDTTMTSKDITAIMEDTIMAIEDLATSTEDIKLGAKFIDRPRTCLQPWEKMFWRLYQFALCFNGDIYLRKDGRKAVMNDSLGELAGDY